MKCLFAGREDWGTVRRTVPTSICRQRIIYVVRLYYGIGYTNHPFPYTICTLYTLFVEYLHLIGGWPCAPFAR